MRLAYGDSNVLKCNVQFAYDRFFTSFSDKDGGVPVNTELGLINSNEVEFPDFSGQTIDPKYQIGDGAGFI